jgi:hypothetical protein
MKSEIICAAIPFSVSFAVEGFFCYAASKAGYKVDSIAENDYYKI